ncbi:MAG: helix-hairpin-helix domain-containing protein [Bacteroidaceae bacterium]|nr:helix-hairpin-helix domain-containing protein [Bacteroidaceae bacterium]
MPQPFSKHERKAICVVVALLTLIIGLGVVLRPYLTTKHTITLSEEALSELKHFDSVTSIVLIKQEQRYEPSVPQYETFDPNTIDSAEFMALGFPAWLTSNALKYRRAGGRWRDAEEFRQLYGMSDERFSQIKPYIKIIPTPEEKRHDSVAKQHPPKFDGLTKLDLNSVDTLTLQRIPGIGKHYARRIVEQRNRLGGFVDVAQLRDIEDLPPRIEDWFEVQSDFKPQKQSLNDATFKALVRHPYLNYEQVKVIKNHIKKYGRIKAWGELQMYKVFTPTDINRLKIYFEFDTPQVNFHP